MKNSTIITVGAVRTLEGEKIRYRVNLSRATSKSLFRGGNFTMHGVSVPRTKNRTTAGLSTMGNTLGLLATAFGTETTVGGSGTSFMIKILNKNTVINSLNTGFTKEPYVSLVSAPLSSGIYPGFGRYCMLPRLSGFELSILPGGVRESFCPLASSVDRNSRKVTLRGLGRCPGFSRGGGAVVFSSNSSVFGKVVSTVGLITRTASGCGLILVNHPLGRRCVSLVSGRGMICINFVS